MRATDKVRNAGVLYNSWILQKMPDSCKHNGRFSGFENVFYILNYYSVSVVWNCLFCGTLKRFWEKCINILNHKTPIGVLMLHVKMKLYKYKSKKHTGNWGRRLQENNAVTRKCSIKKDMTGLQKKWQITRIVSASKNQQAVSIKLLSQKNHQLRQVSYLSFNINKFKTLYRRTVHSKAFN
jgi:hypothetical protein